MINNFKRIIGNEKDIIVCFGNYEQKKHLKFKELRKGIGMRTFLRKEKKNRISRNFKHIWLMNSLGDII